MYVKHLSAKMVWKFISIQMAIRTQSNNAHSCQRLLTAIPGADEAIQAVGAAYTALANIGNDMSPITRKKAKKILLATLIVGQIATLRRM
jgi:hypothetical protein